VVAVDEEDLVEQVRRDNRLWLPRLCEATGSAEERHGNDDQGRSTRVTFVDASGIHRSTFSSQDADEHDGDVADDRECVR
jgi:hypothetical protein